MTVKYLNSKAWTLKKLQNVFEVDFLLFDARLQVKSSLLTF